MNDLINAANIVYSEYMNLINQEGLSTFIHYALTLSLVIASFTLLWGFVVFIDKTFTEKFWIFTKAFVFAYISLMWAIPLIHQHIKMACLPIFLFAEYCVLRLMLYFIKDNYNQVVDIKYIKYETVDIKYVRKHGGYF